MYHRVAPIRKDEHTNFQSQSYNEKINLLDRLLQDSAPVLRNVPTPVRLKQSKTVILHGTERGNFANAHAARHASKGTEDFMNLVRKTDSAPATAAQEYVDPISDNRSPLASAAKGKDNSVRVQRKDSLAHEIKLTPDTVIK